MKNLQQITFYFLILLLSINYSNAQHVVGNGNIVKENRDVSPFSSIIVSDGWDLTLKQGETHAMLIEADENFIGHLKTEVSNGTLRIYADVKMVKHNGSKSKIYLTFKDLNSLTASEGSDIDAETSIKSERIELKLSSGSDLSKFNLRAKQLMGRFSSGSDVNITFESIQQIDIEANGGSDLVLRKISGESCKLKLSGGSDAILDGAVSKLEITAGGGSDIEAYNLEVKNCALDLSGSSDAQMNVTGTLDITLSGGSDVSCTGNPQITNQNICKSCDLVVRR